MAKSTKPRASKSAAAGALDFLPLKPQRMDALGEVLRGSWGSGCWCMFPRLTDAQTRALPGDGPLNKRRREAMTKAAGRKPAPGLLAFANNEPVGWVAIAPRRQLARLSASRATPPVDDQDVWVIPCITVRRTARGRGIAVALIRAAVKFAAGHGASIVEAYPRAGNVRTGDDNAYFGTEPLFRRAGFQVERGPIADRPKNWLPRLAMRIDARDR
jgi:GNAT superfamily N-acetyltransferase